ncbi:hypothetical protein Nepgr_020932 [Nepenthes gracilis]|uniref:Uncharacterized protein n=1 Tax=Nepenthes gracilis TaxID=150966 RepID=A0AAD3SY67_NEPGR|nr:hypothetical protein Nepgr_020932 [Nepenthes gracilis]
MDIRSKYPSAAANSVPQRPYQSTICCGELHRKEQEEAKTNRSRAAPHEFCNEPFQWSTIIQIFTNRVGINSQQHSTIHFRAKISIKNCKDTTFHGRNINSAHLLSSADSARLMKPN